MEKYFVPYYIAKELKEIGFDEECFAIYNDGNILLLNQVISHNKRYFPQIEEMSFCVDLDADVPAPLYDQVIDWFIEKHGLHLEVSWELINREPRKIQWWMFVSDIMNDTPEEYTLPTFHSSRYEALNAGIQKAVELVREKLKDSQEKKKTHE